MVSLKSIVAFCRDGTQCEIWQGTTQCLLEAVSCSFERSQPSLVQGPDSNVYPMTMIFKKKCLHVVVK